MFGRDGWANGNSPDLSAQPGFHRELLKQVHFLDEADINSIVFITTDVHFTAQIRQALDANGDEGHPIFHEPTTECGYGSNLDPTLNPTLLCPHGEFFNFSYVETQPQADETGHLIVTAGGKKGQTRSGSVLDLFPQ